MKSVVVLLMMLIILISGALRLKCCRTTFIMVRLRIEKMDEEEVVHLHNFCHDFISSKAFPRQILLHPTNIDFGKLAPLTHERLINQAIGSLVRALLANCISHCHTPCYSPYYLTSIAHLGD